MTRLPYRPGYRTTSPGDEAKRPRGLPDRHRHDDRLAELANPTTPPRSPTQRRKAERKDKR